MSVSPQVEIKIVYGGRSRKGRSRWSYSPPAAPARRLIALGLVNLLFAGGLYYGTWWHADRQLQVLLLMHMEFSGVDTDAVVSGIIPKDAPPLNGKAPATVRRAPPATAAGQGLTSRGILFGSTIYGWEALSTLAMCLLALSSGRLLRRAGSSSIRVAGALVGLPVIAGLVWLVFSRWEKFGGYVPDELRFSSGAAIVAVLLFGLLCGRRTRGWTLLAAVMLILSAGGTVWGLYFGAQCDAIDPKYATTGFLALAFGLQSLWGWILLPVAARLPK